MLHILMPLDGSALAEAAVVHAHSLASKLTARITLLRIVIPEEFRSEESFSRVDWRLQRQQAGAYLERIAKSFEADGIPCEVHVEEGFPAELIMAKARELDIDLLVMSTHGSGAATAFPRGGVAGKVLSTFEESVFLVGPNSMPQRESASLYRHLLVPVDGSHASDCALRVGVSLARSHGSRLTIVFVCQTPEVPSILSENDSARSLCSEIADMAQRAAQHKLVELRARLPKEIDLETTVRLTAASSNPIVEIAQEFKPDLLVISRTMTSPSNGPDTSTTQVVSAVNHVPVLALNPREIGDAFCVSGINETSQYQSADVS